MTLAEAVARFEAQFVTVSEEIGFPCEPGTADGIRRDGRDWSRAPDGQRYIPITNGGAKPEGEPFPASEPTEGAAIEAWLSEATKFANGKTAQLWWREKPEIVDLTRRGSRRIAVYSRFAVSA